MTDTNSSQLFPMIPPPTPYDEYIMDITGTFDYIKDAHVKKMLINCWQAVLLTNTFYFFKEKPEKTQGYLFSQAPEIKIIISQMKKLPNFVDHTGFTFVWTLRQINYIVIHGEEKYKELYI